MCVAEQQGSTRLCVCPMMKNCILPEVFLEESKSHHTVFFHHISALTLAFVFTQHMYTVKDAVLNSAGYWSRT